MLIGTEKFESESGRSRQGDVCLELSVGETCEHLWGSMGWSCKTMGLMGRHFMIIELNW